MAGKIIILEGIDRTGKSTFAKWLHDYKGFESCHFGKPNGDAFVNYADFFFNTIEPDIDKKDFVVDRFMYGEFVWAPIFRRPTKMDYQKLKFLETYFAKYDTRLVIAETPLEENWRLIKEENEGVITSKEMAVGIREHFRALAASSNLTTAMFDYTAMRTDKFFDQIYPEINNITEKNA